MPAPGERMRKNATASNHILILIIKLHRSYNTDFWMIRESFDQRRQSIFILHDGIGIQQPYEFRGSFSDAIIHRFGKTAVVVRRIIVLHDKIEVLAMLVDRINAPLVLFGIIVLYYNNISFHNEKAPYQDELSP